MTSSWFDRAKAESRSASEIACERIRDYWHKRGYDGILAWVDEVSGGTRGTMFVIRTNIGTNGFPPKGDQCLKN